MGLTLSPRDMWVGTRTFLIFTWNDIIQDNLLKNYLTSKFMENETQLICCKAKVKMAFKSINPNLSSEMSSVLAHKTRIKIHYISLDSSSHVSKFETFSSCVSTPVANVASSVKSSLIVQKIFLIPSSHLYKTMFLNAPSLLPAL